MTYKEFEKWCEESGYVCKSDNTCLKVYSHGCTVLDVTLNAMYSLGSDWTNAMPKELFEKAVELASTPLEEREEPKRYIVKVPKGGGGGLFEPEEPGFYALRECGTLRYMHHNYDPDLTSHYELTEEQIKKIDERFMAFAVEVEE